MAKKRPVELIEMLDSEFELIRLLNNQRNASYSFGDVLVARAGSKGKAARGITSGRMVEDEIEAVVKSLDLPYATRTRFTGRQNRTAPCDLVVESSVDAKIVVAAKGFNVTGSKLTDAVREVQEMADVRRPNQFTMAVIDGIGWIRREADLRRIYDLWANHEIDGMYTLASLDRFKADLADAARLRGLHPTD